MKRELARRPTIKVALITGLVIFQHLLETSNSLEEAGVINYTIRTPLGVAGLISPWNLPLYLLTFKIGPALITGIRESIYLTL